MLLKVSVLLLAAVALHAGQRPSPVDAQVVELVVRHGAVMPSDTIERPCVLVRKALGAARGRKLHMCSRLSDLFAAAWSINSVNVVAPTWVFEETYEVYAETPADIADYRPLLRQILTEKFAADVVVERRPTRSLVLRTPQGEPSLPASRATECTQSDNAVGPVLATTGTPSDMPIAADRLIFRGCTVGDIARSLELKFGLKVVDETTARGRYDFAVDLDGPPFLNGVPAFPQVPRSNEKSLKYAIASLRQVLGAELLDTMRPNEKLIIRDLRRIRGSIRYQRKT